MAGLEAARERGPAGVGGPQALPPAKLKQARRMLREGTPVTEVAQVLEVSRATLYRWVPGLVEGQRTRYISGHRDVAMAGYRSSRVTTRGPRGPPKRRRVGAPLPRVGSGSPDRARCGRQVRTSGQG